MLVYHNPAQDVQFSGLIRIHVLAKDNLPNFDHLIKDLTSKLKSNEKYLQKTQINRDGLLGSLRRIEWAFKKYQHTTFDTNGHDEREAMVLIFFHNAKAFIEITRKCFTNVVNSNKKLSRDITTIRNFFAHSYEKDFLETKTFVRIDLNHEFNEGLLKLQIFDLETGSLINSLYFSLESFYYDIGKLTENILKIIEEN